MSTANSDAQIADSIVSTAAASSQKALKKVSRVVNGYVIPKLPEQDPRKDINIPNWHLYKLPGRGKRTYLDIMLDQSKKDATPGCKFSQRDWIKENNSKTLNGISTKDCFHNKSPRVLEGAQIAKTVKKRPPPLGTHKPVFELVEPRTRGLPLTSVEKGQINGNEEYAGQASPGAKYDIEKGEQFTMPKRYFARIYEQSPQQTRNEEMKIKREKGRPDPCSYDSPRSFNKTQVHGVERKGVPILPGKRRCFIDEVPAVRNVVPGPGNYKSPEKAYAKLSGSPRSIRMNRH